MTPVTLKAHFDGKHITLDEPYDLQPNTPIAVLVFPAANDLEKQSWNQTSAAGLARAYSEDEPEYTLEDVNP